MRWPVEHAEPKGGNRMADPVQGRMTGPGASPRRALRVSTQELVHQAPLEPGKPLPWLIPAAHAGLDLPWQEVFQTSDPEAVGQFCRTQGTEYEWEGDRRLRTRQVCQAVATHPQTGEMVWFNQAHLFHISGLPTEVRAALLSAYQEDELPRNAYYGDGSRIEPEALAEVRRALAEEAVAFPWQGGDVTLLDNMLAAHARAPFVGPRKIVVGMAEPYRA